MDVFLRLQTHLLYTGVGKRVFSKTPKAQEMKIRIDQRRWPMRRLLRAERGWHSGVSGGDITRAHKDT